MNHLNKAIWQMTDLSDKSRPLARLAPGRQKVLFALIFGMWWLLGLSDTKDALVRANLANLQVLKRRLYPGLVSLFCLGHGGALSQGWA